MICSYNGGPLTGKAHKTRIAIGSGADAFSLKRGTEAGYDADAVAGVEDLRGRGGAGVVDRAEVADIALVAQVAGADVALDPVREIVAAGEADQHVARCPQRIGEIG